MTNSKILDQIVMDPMDPQQFLASAEALSSDATVEGSITPNPAADVAAMKMLRYLADMVALQLKLVDHHHCDSSFLSARTLTQMEGTPLPDRVDVAGALEVLAVLCHLLGRTEIAISIVIRSLQTREKIWGPENLMVTPALDILAQLYRNKGQHEMAIPCCQRALNIRRDFLLNDDAELCTNRAMLESLLRESGKKVENQEIRKDCVVQKEHSSTAENPDLAFSLCNEAWDAFGKKEFEKAEGLFQEALTILEQSVGPDHPDVADLCCSIARFYSYFVRKDRAIPPLKRAVEIRQKCLNQEDPELMQTVRQLADLYCQNGLFIHAEPLYERVLPWTEKTDGPYSPLVSGILSALREIYETSNRKEEAELLNERLRIIAMNA